MEGKMSDLEEKTTSIIKIEEMSLEEAQLAGQLYNSAGLDPVVDAGLKDYDKRLQLVNKLINKVLGPSGSDIKGYGEAVAKRVAFAIYTLLNKQYGGKVGNLRSYIMTLEEERDRSNTKYDELMGNVVGILGDEYKELRTDSKAFMERLTATLGEDAKKSRIDYKALAERLADIDGLRLQIRTLVKEKEQLKGSYESQITALKNEHNEEVGTLVKEKEQLKESCESQVTALKNEHNEEVGNLRSQIAELDSRVKGLESEKTTLTNDLAQVREDYGHLKTAITTLAKAIPHEEIGKKLGEELHDFLLKDSKVPGMVIDGVGKFIDFRKYLGMAAKKGAELASKHVEQTLSDILKE